MNGAWQCYTKWNKLDKDKYCMILFICRIKTKTTAAENWAHRYGEQIGGGQMLGVGVGEMSEWSQKHKLPVTKMIESRGWNVQHGAHS